MNDPFSKLLDEIRKEAESGGMHIFYGYLAEDGQHAAVHWNQENGGDWKKFLVCARTLGTQILYMNWAPFEQFEIDDAVSKLESELTGASDADKETQKLINQIRGFQPKVGLTCVIDLAFVANGVVHICQQTADWFDEFGDLIGEDQEEDEPEKKTPASKEVVDKWARMLASDSKYSTTREHEYLLEKLAGEEFSKLPTYEVLRRAEAIFQVDFKQAADAKLAEEIQELRSQGLNINAIAMKLGISRDRVSGLISAPPRKKNSFSC